MRKYVNQTSGNTLAFDSYGDGDDAILFVHGWAGGRSVWVDQIEFFQEKYRVITVDLPGHGESSWGGGDATISMFANDLLSLVSHLNLKSVILIGHSMAGRIIACMAAKNLDTIRCMIGVEAFWNVSSASPSDATLKFIDNLNVDFYHTYRSYIETMFLDGVSLPKVRRIVFDVGSKSDRDVLLQSLCDALMGDAQLYDWLASAKCQKFTINSSLWRETNLSAAKKVNLKVAFIDNAGHYVMLEKPNELNVEIDKILTKITR